MESDKSLRMIWRILALLVSTVMLVALAATPAQASWSDCVVPRACMWIDTNAGGSMYYWGTDIPLNTCVYIGPPFHDAVTSIKNNYNGGSPRKITVYKDINCSGAYVAYSAFQHYFGPGQSKDLAGTLANDTASSFYVFAA